MSDTLHSGNGGWLSGPAAKWFLNHGSQAGLCLWPELG